MVRAFKYEAFDVLVGDEMWGAVPVGDIGEHEVVAVGGEGAFDAVDGGADDGELHEGVLHAEEDEADVSHSAIARFAGAFTVAEPHISEFVYGVVDTDSDVLVYVGVVVEDARYGANGYSGFASYVCYGGSGAFFTGGHAWNASQRRF